MIEVTKERFNSELAKGSYSKEVVDLGSIKEYYYRDSMGKLVAWNNDTSYSNSYKLIPELCSKIEILDYYSIKINSLEGEISHYKDRYNRLRDYNNLNLIQKLVYKYKLYKKRQWNKRHPGLMEFPDESNNIPYHPTSIKIKK